MRCLAAGRALGRAYRDAVTAGRWVIVAVWVAAATLVTVLAPSGSGGGGGFGDLLPPDSQVLKVEERVLEEFQRARSSPEPRWWSTSPGG